MKSNKLKSAGKKIALIFSFLSLVVWIVLETGTSLAWFSDTSPEIKNIFHIANFELEVSYLNEDNDWEKIEGDTKIFDDEALYEPGYVQVAYLKIRNAGDREFEFHTAVNVTGYNTAINVFGHEFNLQDHLKFGVYSSTSEDEILSILDERDSAERIANQKLNHYYKTDTALLNPNEITYLALIVRMPKEVDNVANYRGTDIPSVELGIIVRADQIQN